MLQKLPLPGRRYYLVQDFEPYFYPVGSEYIQAENTYRSGLHCLTLGPWLAQLMREQYGAEADYFDFAVDTEMYKPLPVPRPAHPRIAFYARPSTPRRAYELGVEALRLVKSAQPDVGDRLLWRREAAARPPFPVTNAGILNPWELAKLFSTCDIGLVFSTTNPSFVPLEMMACRCAVVDLASERVEGLLEDGVNCRLAQPTPESIAGTLLDLVWDRPQRERIVETAYQQVKRYVVAPFGAADRGRPAAPCPAAGAARPGVMPAATTSRCWPGRFTNCSTPAATMPRWSMRCAARSIARWPKRRRWCSMCRQVEERYNLAAGSRRTAPPGAPPCSR